jgi:hypothetical protein
MLEAEAIGTSWGEKRNTSIINGSIELIAQSSVDNFTA